MINAGESLGGPGAHADDGVLNRQRPVRFSIAATAIAFFMALAFRPDSNITAFFLHRQDRWLLLIGAGLMALSFYKLSARARLPDVRWRTVLVVAAALLLVTLAGHSIVLAGYDMSRDEQMASFDATVFAHGHLVAPIPAFWRDHADALNTTFMYPAMHRGAWISQYLPLNAGLRAVLLVIFGAPYLAGPLMTALGAIALFGCVRKIWPDDREAAFIALMLYAGSAQVLFAGMTSYAMPAHLALNLCWLWLFLKRRWASDSAALVVGFVAMGLHQPLMHPMFAGPFLLLLLIERRWDRAALYFTGYALAGVFWLWWPHWTSSLVQSSVFVPQAPSIGYMARLVNALHDRDAMGTPDMVANFLRFIAWQHLLLVPLVLIGVRQYRNNPMIAALAGGIVVTTLFMTVALPYQGHGFGYRYLHGLIGNCILLAIYGWKSLGDELASWRTLLLRTTAASVIVLMPLQAWMAHGFYAPAARASARIDTMSADYVVIGIVDAPYASDLVFNPPMLDRRPVRLLREEIDDGAMAAICASHPLISLIDNATLAPVAAYYALGAPRADELNPPVASRLARAGCRVRKAV